MGTTCSALRGSRMDKPIGVDPAAYSPSSSSDCRIRDRCPEEWVEGQRDPSSSTVSDTTESTGSSDCRSSCPIRISPGVEPLQNNIYRVLIPSGVSGGDVFPITILGQELMISCPSHAREGTHVLLQVFHDRPGSVNNSEVSDPSIPSPPSAPNDATTRIFEATIPEGVSGGQPFAIMADERRIIVTCPPDAVTGQRIRFPLPVNVFQDQDKITSESRQEIAKRLGIDEIALNYDDGWSRTIRVVDVKGNFQFQWARQNQEEGAVDMNARFDAKTSAYVRKLEYITDGENGPCITYASGKMSLVPATELSVDSCIVSEGEEIVSYADLATAQTKSYEDKIEWFYCTCDRLRLEWDQGHVRMNVRRDTMLRDSLGAVMSLNQKDLKKIWRIQFIGEEGIDAGGVSREWFQLVTEQLFNPESGLWIFSNTNQMCMQINPASGIIMEEHLIYYRFLGRIMGKALFDRQLVTGHMVRHFYKHMLGWPVTLNDIEHIDEEIYKNLKNLLSLTEEELEYAYLDFTVTENVMGANNTVELIPGGTDIDLSKDNLAEFLEANLKYRLAGCILPQLTELLLGFFDVIPEPLMTVFDFQELELLMCGLPEIDIDDWQDHTEYSGLFEESSGINKWCYWFWEIVENDFDQETRARLLQFVTGTSGVPSAGFAVLQGNDGRIKKFTLHGVNAEICLYPHAHTCFNRIDIPCTSTKAELLERLKFSVEMASTGFGME